MGRGPHKKNVSQFQDAIPKVERLKYLREAFANAKLDRYPWRKVATGEWVAPVTENNRALVPFYCDLSRISEPIWVVSVSCLSFVSCVKKTLLFLKIRSKLLHRQPSSS